MKPILVLAALAVLATTPPRSAQAAEGYAAPRMRAAQAHPRKQRRPVVRKSSAKEPGGRCGRLNLERARLYGLCR